jgi:O-antigen/teichoic acid export membrane protein
MVPDTLLQRRLRFRTKLLPDISRNFIKGVISIVLAAAGFGVWSLVWGQIAGIFTGTVLAWVLAGWKPTWRFNAIATRAIAIYGFHIVMIEVLGVFRNSVDYLLVGRILGAAALGYYTLSFRIPELLIRSVNNAIGAVSLPALASMQSDAGRLHSFYFGYIRYLSMFTFPVGVGLAMTAPLFIPLFLSETWGPAIAPTMLISFALGISALGYVPGVLYKAVNRPEVLNQLAVVKIPFAVFILWYSTRWGIIGVAAGQIALSLISVSIDTLIANYIMKFSLKDLLDTISVTFISTLAMGLALHVVRRSMPYDGLFALVLMIAAGVLVYFAMLWLLSRETLFQGINMFRKAFFKSRLVKSAPVEIVSKG